MKFHVSVQCSEFSAASGQQNGQFDRITNFMKMVSKFMKLDTSAAAGPKNGQFNRKRNFGLVLLICVAYLAIE